MGSKKATGAPKTSKTTKTTRAAAPAPVETGPGVDVVLLDAHHQNPDVVRVPEQAFRITVGGVVYEQCGEWDGKRAYSPMR